MCVLLPYGSSLHAFVSPCDCLFCASLWRPLCKSTAGGVARREPRPVATRCACASLSPVDLPLRRLEISSIVALRRRAAIVSRPHSLSVVTACALAALNLRDVAHLPSLVQASAISHSLCIYRQSCRVRGVLKLRRRGRRSCSFLSYFPFGDSPSTVCAAATGYALPHRRFVALGWRSQLDFAVHVVRQRRLLVATFVFYCSRLDRGSSLLRRRAFWTTCINRMVALYRSGRVCSAGL